MTTDPNILRRAIARMAVKRVNPEAFYPVGYTTAPDGQKHEKETRLKGGELTFNQIVELAIKGHFD